MKRSVGVKDKAAIPSDDDSLFPTAAVVHSEVDLGSNEHGAENFSIGHGLGVTGGDWSVATSSCAALSFF